MAAFEKRSKQIGEFTYDVTMLGAKVANRVLMKLGKSVGPMFMLAAMGGAGGIARAVDAIKELNEDDFEWVVGQLAAKTDVTYPDGKSPTLATIFDSHFAGRYAEEMEWIEFAIDVNFGPFFLALKQKAEAAKAAKSGGTTPTP